MSDCNLFKEIWEISGYYLFRWKWNTAVGMKASCGFQRLLQASLSGPHKELHLGGRSPTSSARNPHSHPLSAASCRANTHVCVSTVWLICRMANTSIYHCIFKNILNYFGHTILWHFLHLFFVSQAVQNDSLTPRWFLEVQHPTLKNYFKMRVKKWLKSHSSKWYDKGLKTRGPEFNPYYLRECSVFFWNFICLTFVHFICSQLLPNDRRLHSSNSSEW